MVVLVVTLVALGPAAAQERRESHCIALVDGASGMAVIERAAYTDPLPEFTVRISYLAHAMFLLQTPGGLSAVTDYTGFLGTADFVPDVATMNRAHATHWTAYPDPRIPHVLPGWASDGGRAEHHLDLGEMLVRNVTTDIRSWGTDLGRDGNSVFIFEVAGLCIGHLGHLHHEPTPAQYAAIGRLDVVMAPVDGGATLDLPTMIRVLGHLRSSIVIPMHWFGRGSLDIFLAGMAGDFAIERPGATSVEVSLRTLPRRPTVLVLEPAYLTTDD
ncbi:MAG: MBL fold metallo-hydrolase [Rhodobacteraceae bacterium]|nr:MBL fold metallo-hydrolase [Paracoccaceae bacterium]